MKHTHLKNLFDYVLTADKYESALINESFEETEIDLLLLEAVKERKAEYDLQVIEDSTSMLTDACVLFKASDEQVEKVADFLKQIIIAHTLFAIKVA